MHCFAFYLLLIISEGMIWEGLEGQMCPLIPLIGKNFNNQVIFTSTGFCKKR